MPDTLFVSINLIYSTKVCSSKATSSQKKLQIIRLPWCLLLSDSISISPCDGILGHRRRFVWHCMKVWPYSCFQKGSRNVLFFLLLDAFRRLDVAERKWVNPTHLVYLFFEATRFMHSQHACDNNSPWIPLYKYLWKAGAGPDQRANPEENFSRVWAVPRCSQLPSIHGNNRLFK